MKPYSTYSPIPLISDYEDAIYCIAREPNSPVVKAKAVECLIAERIPTKKIMKIIGANHRYYISNYKKILSRLDDDLFELWRKNEDRLSFGHMTIIAKHCRFDEMKGRMLTTAKKKQSCADLKKELKKVPSNEAMDKFADKVSTTARWPVTIETDASGQKGTINFHFTSLLDLNAFLETYRIYKEGEF